MYAQFRLSSQRNCIEGNGHHQKNPLYRIGEMGKQTKPENMGKGKVTPIQVAFIIDRYLSDNNYTHTRSTFRTEASLLLSKSLLQEAPKSLLSLGAMLDEYISLKEQRVILDQEKCRLEHEKLRVHNLLKGMQNVMNAYNASGAAPAPTLPPMPPQIELTNGSPAGYPTYSTPVMMSTTRPTNTLTDSTNFSTPITTHQTSKKRKGSKDASDAPATSKRSRSPLSTNQLQATGIETVTQPNNASNNQEASFHTSENNGSLVQGSNVAKCLFNQPIKTPPTNSSCPKTPPRAIRVSPVKQMAYHSVERSNHISSSLPIKANPKRVNKRDHVKGRLNFDGSNNTTIDSEKSIPCGISGSESEKDSEMFDLDLTHFDALSADFSLSQIWLDLSLDGDGMNYFCQPAVNSSPDALSGSPDTSENDNMDANQLMSEPSALTEVLSEKDMNTPGPDSVTSLKSMTKCIKNLSSVNNDSSLDQENLSARS